MSSNVEQTIETTESRPIHFTERIIRENVDKLILDKEYDSFVNVYNVIKAYSHIPEIKKLINKKNVHKSLSQIYRCNVCNIEMKTNYKHLHNNTKKHLAKVSESLKDS